MENKKKTRDVGLNLNFDCRRPGPVVYIPVDRYRYRPVYHFHHIHSDDAHGALVAGSASSCTKFVVGASGG